MFSQNETSIHVPIKMSRHNWTSIHSAKERRYGKRRWTQKCRCQSVKRQTNNQQKWTESIGRRTNQQRNDALEMIDNPRTWSLKIPEHDLWKSPDMIKRHPRTNVTPTWGKTMHVMFHANPWTNVIPITRKLMHVTPINKGTTWGTKTTPKPQTNTIMSWKSKYANWKSMHKPWLEN